jgi:aryl-alcohol dehydrogenase-like predicted oxidoreductase
MPDAWYGFSVHRREFIKAATAAAFLGSLGQKLTFGNTSGGMPYRVLGHTGEKVSLLGIGGAHIGEARVPEAVGIQIVRAALDAGVTFLDNAWDYNDGRSELRMGQALRDGYRAKAFLMTKTDGRDAGTATAQLDESLRRLQTDHVDLIQLHDIHAAAEAEQIFGPGGAIEGLVAARKAGKTRYIGFTGHKDPAFHLHLLQVADQHGFLFDTVQMPLNVLDAHYKSFGQQVLPVLTRKNIGVLGMKPMSARDVFKANTGVTPAECLHFAMNLPISVCITGCDSMEILDQALNAARSFKAMSETEVAALLLKTEAVAADGQYETYKFAQYP